MIYRLKQHRYPLRRTPVWLEDTKGFYKFILRNGKEPPWHKEIRDYNKSRTIMPSAYEDSDFFIYIRIELSRFNLNKKYPRTFI